MKTFQYSRGKIFSLIMAGSLAAVAIAFAGEGRPNSAMSNGNANVQVYRAADFGTIISLSLYIDGVQVTSLGLNQSYRAVVRPGEHTLTVGTTPNPTGKTRFYHHKARFDRGGTYVFTAMWEYGDHCYLETGAAAARARSLPWY